MGILTTKPWDGVANAFRLFLSEFLLFCQKVDFFHPLNRNDGLKESESGVGVGVIEILEVGVGILGILGVGVGPYTFRLRNPGFNTCHYLPLPFLKGNICLVSALTHYEKKKLLQWIQNRHQSYALTEKIQLTLVHWKAICVQVQLQLQ